MPDAASAAGEAQPSSAIASAAAATSASPAASGQLGSEVQALTGPQKALVFLVSMDEGLATRIMSKLSDEQVGALRQVSAEMIQVSPQTIAAVHLEFVERSGGGGSASLSGSGSYLRRLAGKALGEGRAAELWSAKMAPGPFAELGRLDATTILGLLESEQPQTIAVVLSQLDNEKAAQVIGKMTADRQAEVVLRIARLEGVPESVVQDIEDEFAQEVSAIKASGRSEVGGLTVASGLLKRLPPEETEQLLDALTSADAHLAEQLRGAMFVFEDLLRIDSRGMQALLKQIQTDKLVLALKNASEDLQEKIFGNLSSRAAGMLREELELLGPVRVTDVEQAQQEIVEIALNLERENKISIAREGGGDFV
ncbi:MAG: flagellar motor switch protein FliG [Proteobacteria bacterium]|nr:flagellar motor switch protein FliG [Pseudomonadota bacterium]